MDNGYSSRVTAATRAAVEASGISVNALATTIGIPRVTLIRRLEGHQEFTFGQVAAIAEAIGVSIESLTAPEAAA